MQQFLSWGRKALLCASVCFLASCAQQEPLDNAFISTRDLALSETSPQLRFEQENMLLRLTEVLNTVKLADKERAELYFERGVIYDSLGLWSMASSDFTLALELFPKMAAAYNYAGLYLLLNDDYDSAIDAFNAVLELDSDYNYAYLNRGLAFYYSGRFTTAQRDFQRFYQADRKDPYRVLWLYFNELEWQPEQAIHNLKQRAKDIPADAWGTQIIRYFLGELTLTQLRTLIEEKSEVNSVKRAELLTETYFYLAKQKLKANQEQEATSFFRLVLANQVYNYVEYRFAQFELAKLRNARAEAKSTAIVGKHQND